MVKAVDLRVLANSRGGVGGYGEAYLLTSKLILEERRAFLVFGGNPQPAVCVALLHTVVAGDSPFVIVDVLGDGSKLRHLARLLSNEVLGLLRNIA